MGARQSTAKLGDPVKHPHPHPPKDPVYRAQTPLELVHIDTSGPLSTGAWDGRKYWVVIVDDYSRKSWILLVRDKTEIPQRVKEWKVVIEAEAGSVIRKMRSDNGTKFTGAEFVQRMAEKRTSMETTAPGNPQSNGVAERMNRKLQERARSMMAETDLSPGGWRETVKCASYMRKRRLVRGRGDKTPEVLWSGKVPSVRHMRAHGCKAFCEIEKIDRSSKLGVLAWEEVLLGYSETSPAYRIWDPRKKRVMNVGSPSFDSS